MDHTSTAVEGNTLTLGETAIVLEEELPIARKPLKDHLPIVFSRIHPFYDGNGRLARLVANLPVLMAGLPPIIVPREQREAYIDALSAYHFAVGQIRAGDEWVPESEKEHAYSIFA